MKPAPSVSAQPSVAACDGVGKDVAGDHLAVVEVLAVDGDRVWLQARQATVCNRCQLRTGCGQNLLAALRAPRPGTLSLPLASVPVDVRVGERLQLAVPAGAVARAAAVVYGLPLLGLLAGAGLASVFAGGDGPALLLAGLGFMLGGLLSRQAQGRQTAQAMQCRRDPEHPAGEPGSVSVV